MEELYTKHGSVIVYAKTLEPEALSQIYEMANSPLGENAYIRIMPDAHAGAGCVIGTTMKITDKVCPNLVGVDIGCGVSLYKTDLDFKSILPELDKAIRTFVPSGKSIHPTQQEQPVDLTELRCWEKISPNVQERAKCSLGTLGSGNHFIEAYEGGYIAVHTGSRNIGLAVATHYQNLAVSHIRQKNMDMRNRILETIPPEKRQEWLKSQKIAVSDELCYLEGAEMDNYIHDIAILQDFAKHNRATILSRICKVLRARHAVRVVDSVHNYIDVDNRILRKGAISAQEGELLVIPMNMRDGLLVCRGKGNPEWNNSAPHGAGRLYSRSKAKAVFSVEEYERQMEGIYSSCINQSTLDEAPFVYKAMDEIVDAIHPTVEIEDRLIPIFNFKASE